MEGEATIGNKKASPLFSLGGTPIASSKSRLPIGELRALGKDVQAAHPLRGALRLICDEWILGIKFPTKASAEQISSLLCFRWDGHFGSALTLTVGAKSRGWLARGWIWSNHPVLARLHASHALTVVSIYNGEPISILQTKPVGESSLRGIEFAMDKSNEADRRPEKQHIDLDEKLAYWETFALSNAWDALLTAADHLQVGWLREFRNAVRYASSAICDGLMVPELTDANKPHWEESGRQIPLVVRRA